MTIHTQLNRISLRDQVRETLESRITGGQFQPGIRLNLAALARDIDASVTPVREALHQLERDGLVRLEPHRGFVLPELSRQEITDSYPVLAALEALAVRSLRNISQGLLERLSKCNQRLGRARSSPGLVLRLDREWHATLTGAAANHVLDEHLAVLRRRLGLYELFYMRESGQVSFSVDHHAEIMTLLRDGEIHAAASRLEAHWMESVKFLLKWMESGGPADSDTAEQKGVSA